MSVESAKAFLERLKTDEEFSNRVIGFTDEQARMAFIKKSGFTCSPEDIQKAAARVSNAVLTTTADGVGTFRPDTHIAAFPEEKS
jgi:predicted ribosomally synthesized peptide with nif11-like leader